MKLSKCAKCPHRDDEDTCSRYGKPCVKVAACGHGNKDFNRPPFSRRGAENLRRWHKEQKENG